MNRFALISILVVFAFVSTGCAIAVGVGLSGLPTGSRPAPLPESITLVPPDREIPSELARFAGAWSAEVGNRFGGDYRGHVLVVERIASPDEVTVVFGIGGIPNIWGHEWGKSRSERVKARFENGNLVVRSGQWIGIYSMGPDGLVADIQHPFLGFSKQYVYHAMLRKVSFAELRKEANAK